MSANPGVPDLLDGKYRIIRVIGEGGWGVVYEGENLRTLTRVAIKVLRSHAGVTPDIRARFEREAQAGGRIGSDHIVKVFDLGVLADGTHFMVMELLTGEDLASRLRSAGPLPAIVACKLVLQLLDGLGAAHNAGILHRDLKPENLFLERTRSGEDFVKILDFGVSKFSAPGVMSATRTGAVFGSPFYMAPEQARGLKHLDGRTDLYSVGALLFECVTGRVPFDGENFNDLMFKIALSPRPNPLHFRADLDPELVAIIMKAIAADPRERYASAQEFHATLVGWLSAQGAGSTPPERRDGVSWLPASAVPAAALGGSGERVSMVHRSPVPSPMSRAPNASPLPSAATPLSRVGETPMASSSGVAGRKQMKRKRAFLIGLGGIAAVLLLAMVVVGWQRGHRPPADMVSATVSPLPVIPSAGPPVAHAAAVPLPNPAPEAPPPAETAPVATVVATPPPSMSPPAILHPRPVAALPAPAPPPARPPVPPVVVSAPPSPPSVSAVSAEKVEKVEGREIRTTLP